MNGYETSSLKLRQEHKLRVFENRVMRERETGGGLEKTA
jgi:hypothetical protein